MQETFLSREQGYILAPQEVPCQHYLDIMPISLRIIATQSMNQYTTVQTLGIPHGVASEQPDSADVSNNKCFITNSQFAADLGR
jgi:hypothetical protein